MSQRNTLFVLALMCALNANSAQAADALIQQGAQLIKEGKGKAAYALLEPQESTRAGDKDFDLLLGIAALEVGQNTRAIFALERVLAVEPNNVRARAELGRAYLAVGETDAARIELQNAKTLGVPPDVEQTVDRFLSAVDHIENSGKTSVRGYVEGTFGYDTNVNAAPALSQIAVPAFGNLPFTLSENSKAQEDWFATIAGGVNFIVPMDRQLAIVGGLSGSQRLNQDISAADLLSVDGNIGVSYTEGKNVYTLTAQHSALTVENDRYRSALGFSGQVQHNIDARNQASAFVQYANLDYIGQSARDADRWVGGVSYAHAWRDGLVTYGSVYLVDETVHAKEVSPSLGFDGVGIRVGAQQPLSRDWTAFGSLAYETRRGKETDPTFLAKRDDGQLTVNLNLAYQIRKDLKVTGQYAYIDQRSNIDLYKYDRNILSVTVRQDF
jgi:outer membrane protein